MKAQPVYEESWGQIGRSRGRTRSSMSQSVVPSSKKQKKAQPVSEESDCEFVSVSESKQKGLAHLGVDRIEDLNDIGEKVTVKADGNCGYRALMKGLFDLELIGHDNYGHGFSKASA
mmetsp:Transcript_22636/g.49149  ORF Transcript_22636/g.49149 Transcript_22636/m.49149 type:complete len:117 (-) Transcript_22636:853-1203(-)